MSSESFREVLRVLLVPVAVVILATVRPLNQPEPIAQVNGWFLLFVVGFPLSYVLLQALGQLTVQTTTRGRRLHTVIGLGLTIIFAAAISQIFNSG